MHTRVEYRTIGRYEVVDRIGAGGMGEVYRARLRGEGGFVKYVALKSLLPQRSLDAEYLRRFLREAKIVGTLSHPNIVQVFEVLIDESTHYLAMELVDGHDLGSVLLRCATRREPISQVWTTHVLVEALRGLDYAHRKRDESGQPLGIVHRDISPENILVSYDGSVKVTDFGVAKGFQQPTGAFLVGKPRYMPPEQAGGDATIDGRADVYATGVVLWEAMAMTAAAVAGDAWDPRRYEPPRMGEPFPAIAGTPAPLSAAIAKATAADRERRYRDAEAFAADLRRFVAKEMPDFSPLDLGRFVAQVFSTEHDLRAANLKKFEESQARRVPPPEALDPTRLSQRRRGVSPAPSPARRANGPGGEEPTLPSFDLSQLPDSLRQTTPGRAPPEGALRPDAEGPSTDLVLRALGRSRQRRRRLALGTALAVVALSAGVLWWLQRRAGAPERAAPPVAMLPPVRPTLAQSALGPTDVGSSRAPAPAPASEDVLDDVDDDLAEDAPAGRKQPAAASVAEPRESPAAGPRKLAALRVDSDPAGAAIRVNGRATRQRTPATLKGLAVGKRLTVEVALEGYAAESRPVAIADGPNALRVLLRALDGQIRVDGAPPGARILLDGQPVAKNPFPARPGPHRVEIAADGYRPTSREVTVLAGKTAVAAAALARPTGPGRITVICRPFCKLLVDGHDRGMIESGSPLELTIDPGEHRFEARHVQTARRKSQKVTVVAGEATTVAFDLTE